MKETDVIDGLTELARHHDDTAELARVLEGHLGRANVSPEEMRRILAALRYALARHAKEIEGELRCGFCGQPQAKVGTMVVAADNAICDECILAGVEALQRNQRSGVISLALEGVRLAAKVARRQARRKA